MNQIRVSASCFVLKDLRGDIDEFGLVGGVVWCLVRLIHRLELFLVKVVD